MNYFAFNQYQNFSFWQSLMTSISILQCVDIILTIVEALNYELKGDRMIYIYRIVVQVGLILIFHIIMNRLKYDQPIYISCITFCKYICVMICWTETNYNLIYGKEYDQRSHFAELMLITVIFIISVETQIIRSIIICFSLFYQLFRISYFENVSEKIGSARIIICYYIIQFAVLYYWYIQNKEDSLNQRNLSLIITQRGQTTQREQTENKKQEIEEQEPLKQSTQLNDKLLINFSCGIYIYEASNSQLRIINPYMSHIILDDDKLNSNFSSLELYDFGLFQEHNTILRPTFHRTQNLQFEVDDNYSEEKKEIQLFYKKLQFKILIDNLLAFLRLKYQFTKQNLDFTLKIYLQKDKLYTQVILNPIIINNIPQVALYITDLTEEPFHLKSLQLNDQLDQFIQIIQQKIKQPLNCTLTMLELAENQVNQNILEKYIDPALSGCKLLINSQNDIDDYLTLKKKEKLDKNQMDIHTREFLSDCINIIKSQALFRGIAIQINVKQNVPTFLRTDPNRVRQILLNILVKSIKAILNGFIEISCQKSPLITDHIELIIKVIATQVNETVLNQIDQTIKYLKQFTLLNHQVIDITQQTHKLSFSLLTAFYISLAIATMPFEFNILKNEKNTQFYFILLIKNENPNFTQQLNQKRQSALLQQSTFKQVIGQQQNQIRRHQSQRLTEISRIQIKENYEKLKRDSQAETTIERRDSQPAQFGVSVYSNNGQNQTNIISDISEMEDSSIESEQSLDDEFQDSAEVHISHTSHNIQQKINQMEQNRKPSQFFDSIVQVREPPPREPLPNKVIFTHNSKASSPINSNQLSSSQRDSLLTFGGRASVYSSMRMSSINLGPNELLECFEKMEKIKSQQFSFSCDCPKILICEQSDFDLYAISLQLSNLKIPYIYTMQRNNIGTLLTKQFLQKKNCCKGFVILFIGIPFIDQEFSEQCKKIKQIIDNYKKETKLIGLISCQDEEFKQGVKQLQFHDYLTKPIMIDALLFMLAKQSKI